MKKCLQRRQDYFKNIYPEQYWVIIDYQRDDGYWVMNHKEDVWVEIPTDRLNIDREIKNNHEEAGEIGLKQFFKQFGKRPAKLVSVIYL